MSKEILHYIILFIGVVLLQVLICNHIALFNVALPIIFIYFIIKLPISLNPGVLFTLSFLTGLIIDIFSDTPGVNALACTLTAGIKRPVFFAYVDKDDRTENIIPSVAALGIVPFMKYLLSIVVIYCLLAFLIEYFSFANVKEIVIITASSSLFSFLILLAIDCLIPSKL